MNMSIRCSEIKSSVWEGKMWLLNNSVGKSERQLIFAIECFEETKKEWYNVKFIEGEKGHSAVGFDKVFLEVRLKC